MLKKIVSLISGITLVVAGCAIDSEGIIPLILTLISLAVILVINGKELING